MRWMLSAAAVLVGLPALAQQNDAEKLFRSMEKQVREAKSIKLVFSVNGDFGKDNKLLTNGSIVVAEGNKARVDLTAKKGDKELKVQLYSDGKVMGTLINGKSGDKPMPAEPGVADVIPQITARGGIFVFTESDPEPAEKDKFDIDKYLPASDFKLGKKVQVNGQETQPVSCAIKPKKGPPLQMTVWLVTKTNLPLKRELTATEKDFTLTVVENYREFSLNPKVDAKIFEVPKQ